MPSPRRSTATTRPSWSTDRPAPDRGKSSRTSRWPPWAGCTGTTPAAYTATSATSHPQNSKPPSTMIHGPTNPWSESNSPSLQQNQGVSRRRRAVARSGYRLFTINDWESAGKHEVGAELRRPNPL